MNRGNNEGMLNSSLLRIYGIYIVRIYAVEYKNKRIIEYEYERMIPFYHGSVICTISEY